MTSCEGIEHRSCTGDRLRALPLPAALRCGAQRGPRILLLRRQPFALAPCPHKSNVAHTGQ
jgi:hypothetical protein